MMEERLREGERAEKIFAIDWYSTSKNEHCY